MWNSLQSQTNASLKSDNITDKEYNLNYSY